MKLSVSVPDEVWLLAKSRHPNLTNSALVQHALNSMPCMIEPTDEELIELGRMVWAKTLT